MRRKKAQLDNTVPPAPKPPQRSAPGLTWGLVLMLVGQFFYQGGQAEALRASLRGGLYGGSDGSGMIMLGAILSLVGLILLVDGVHRLASGVDTLVRRAAAEDLQVANREG